MIYTPLFFVFFIIVFILVWLFINTIDNRKWLSFLISVIVAPIVYFFIFYPMLNIFSSYHHQKYFNTEAWLKKPALRYEMSKNIITDSLFIGKTKTDVKSQLGTPEWFGWDDTIKANSTEKWNYNLGFKPGALNNMQECIELTFYNQKVKTVRQYQLEQQFE